MLQRTISVGGLMLLLIALPVAAPLAWASPPQDLALQLDGVTFLATLASVSLASLGSDLGSVSQATAATLQQWCLQPGKHASSEIPARFAPIARMLTVGATTGLVALQAGGARSGKIALGMIGAWVGSWLGYFVGIAVSTPVLSVELTWKAGAPTLVLPTRNPTLFWPAAKTPYSTCTLAQHSQPLLWLLPVLGASIAATWAYSL